MTTINQQIIEKLNIIQNVPEWNDARKNWKRISKVQWTKLPRIKNITEIIPDNNIVVRPKKELGLIDIDCDHPYASKLILHYFPTRYLNFGRGGVGHVIQEVSDPKKIPDTLNVKALDFPHPDLDKKTILELRVDECYSVLEGKLDDKPGGRATIGTVNKYASSLPFHEVETRFYKMAILVAMAIACNGIGTRNKFLVHVVGEFKRLNFSLEQSEELIKTWLMLTDRSDAETESLVSLKGLYKKKDKYTTLDELETWTHGMKINFRTWLKKLAPVQEAKDDDEKSFKPLELFDGSSLFETEFSPINWVVPDLIPAGLTILASRPKVGKSWFALGLAKSVCNGLKFLGREVVQGDVLYGALEDSPRRINGRLHLMNFSHNMQFPSFFYDSEKLSDGLEAQLIHWVKNVKNPRLIIVDTMIKAQGHKLKGGMNAYEWDSKMLTAIQKIAIEYNICVLLVHHTKKKKDDDPFDDISGSTGIQGISDTLLHIQVTRGESSQVPTLQVIGRDIESQNIAIQMDTSTFEWEDLGDPGNASLPEMDRNIIHGVNKVISVKEKEAGKTSSPHMSEFEASPIEVYRSLVAEGKIKDNDDNENTRQNYKKKMQRMATTKQGDASYLKLGNRKGYYRLPPF